MQRSHTRNPLQKTHRRRDRHRRRPGRRPAHIFPGETTTHPSPPSPAFMKILALSINTIHPLFPDDYISSRMFFCNHPLLIVSLQSKKNPPIRRVFGKNLML